MDFGSVNFLLIFLPVFTIVYWLIPIKEKSRLIFLGSLLFCGINSLVSLIPLSASIIGNFAFSKMLAKESFLIDKDEALKKRIILTVGIIFNVLLLLIFKLELLGGDGFFQIGLNIKIFSDLMPIGISFYTFTAIGYLVDIYWKEQKPLEIVDFGAFIASFPKLMMGPIVRAKQLEDTEKKIDAYAVQDGIKLLIAGLSLKILLADRLNMLWHELEVTGYECISTPLAWIGVVTFSLKLYFDFFGYSLMAIGIGRMLGLELPDNFKMPYACTSVREFYRCWHMTLGQWFTRYIYIPLGGSRKGEVRTVLNLFIVWMLTAIWHGLTVNYWLWGGLLFLCIAVERQVTRYLLPKLPTGSKSDLILKKVLPHAYLLLVIGISWILFAVSDMQLLQVYLLRLFGLTPAAGALPFDWWSTLCRYWKELIIGLLCATPLMGRLYKEIKDTYDGWLIISVLFWICIYRIIAEGANPFMYGAF